MAAGLIDDSFGELRAACNQHFQTVLIVCFAFV